LPWIDDGTGRIQDKGNGCFEVTGEKEKGDKKYNAMCNVAFAVGEHFFEVEVCSGRGAFIGITTKNGFGDGYKLRAALLGGPGNLSNGSAGLRTGFSKEVVPGAVVGVQLDLREEEKVAVTFWRDGRCLGRAIEVTRPAGEAVFPVVSAKSVGDAFAIRIGPVPDKEAAEPVPAHPAEGTWVLRALRVGPELGEFVLPAMLAEEPVTLKVSLESMSAPDEPKNFSLCFKVGNSIQARLQATPSMPGEAPHPFEAVHLQLGPATMMMPPPELAELEDQIAANLPNVRQWIVRDTILLQGPTVEMELARAAPAAAKPPVGVVLK